ncbi:hypothetical protein F511_24799 [Dorcoceras hygrometricum]|uniref:Uncharacterized protein n=1 Tax=Dorcoceras hygrometricum TaxID=472368 RepID=A0A2Z7CZW0_9LAMI|nr:hypothetical protein F511_24799 [Dorcoceras hygrometricum]
MKSMLITVEICMKDVSPTRIDRDLMCRKEKSGRDKDCSAEEFLDQLEYLNELAREDGSAGVAEPAEMLTWNPAWSDLLTWSPAVLIGSVVKSDEKRKEERRRTERDLMKR